MKSEENIATKALVGLSSANVVNQIFFQGDLTYLEILLTLLFLTILSIRDGK